MNVSVLPVSCSSSKVDVEFEHVQEFGAAAVQKIPTAYNVSCGCGYTARYTSLGAANEALGRHQAGLADPQNDDADVVLIDKRVREDVRRQRDEMVATGDVFAGLDDA